MESVWKKNLPEPPNFPTLDGDLSVEAVVVGGGMAGILTAYELQRRGVEVVVIESETPGAGVTGNTTAKITSQHRLIYHRLLTTLGEARAKQYATANQSAIEDYAALVNTLKIDCDFHRTPAYIYDLKNSDVLRKEAEAAQRLGIPAVFTKEVALPFPVVGAVKFPDQAEFQPLAFLSALLPNLKIYARTTAKSISAAGVETDRGLIHAKHIIAATHFPFFNLPGFYFARMHQDRSYVLALRGAGMPLDGMYLDASPAGYSLRTLGGGGHRSGKTPGDDGYRVLKEAAGRWWPEAVPVAGWSAQDCMPMDGIPYIGAYPLHGANLYVATGFQKWGMTTSMAASHILADRITGRESPNAAVFSPHRLPALAALPTLLKDGGISAGHLLSQVFYVPRAQLKDVAPGQGGVVCWHGKKLGVFHREDGEFFLVPSNCPHLGCQLSWNAAEQTWDCPCHGSRFSYQGQRLDAPATDDLHCRLLQK